VSVMQKPRKKQKGRAHFGHVRKLPSGRHQASYIGPADGKRHVAPNTFDTATDAHAWIAIQHAAIVKGEWDGVTVDRAERAKGTRTETFAEYAESWIATRTNRHGEHLRPRTIEGYRTLLRGPLATFAESRLLAITPEDVRRWHSALLRKGTKTTAARAYELMKAILGTAITDGRISVNPCMIRGGASARTGRKVEPPTAEELETILTTITPRFRAAVVIAAWAATRYGELTELRRKDLTPLDSVAGSTYLIRVDRGVTHTAQLGFMVGPTKSAAGVRSIVLPPHVAHYIREHLAHNVAINPDALLFPAADGTSHLAESTFTKHWYPARMAAGREDMPWHALRHFGLTAYAQTGATLAEIQARAGHSTVHAAMRYQHAADRDAELAARMSSMAKGVVA
jgi:integrase